MLATTVLADPEGGSTQGPRALVDFHGDTLEARVGIEPTNEGFADLSLPTWVPRQWVQYSEMGALFQPQQLLLRKPRSR